MASSGPPYEIEDAETGDVVSRHRTRQAAIDNWRTRFAGRQIRVYRRDARSERTLVVEGTWHESHRSA